MDTDAAGRIWVAEGRNFRAFRYITFKTFAPMGDRILVLTDSDTRNPRSSTTAVIQPSKSAKASRKN